MKLIERMLEKMLLRARPEKSGFIKLECPLYNETQDSIVYFATKEAAKRLKIDYRQNYHEITPEQLNHIDQRTDENGIHTYEAKGLVYFLFVQDNVANSENIAAQIASFDDLSEKEKMRKYFISDHMIPLYRQVISCSTKKESEGTIALFLGDNARFN